MSRLLPDMDLKALRAPPPTSLVGGQEVAILPRGHYDITLSESADVPLPLPREEILPTHEYLTPQQMACLQAAYEHYDQFIELQADPTID